MKNQNILLNIWQILDIINYTEKENIEALILSIDFENISTKLNIKLFLALCKV